MADRYPLIYNPSANQIQELQSGDSLDVGNSAIKGATGYATTTGTSSQFLKADGSLDGTTYLTASGTAQLAQGLTGTPTIDVGDVTGVNATFSGNLTVNGTTTTIDTAVTEVDSLEIAANNNNVAVAITQSGAGKAMTVEGGDVGIGTNNPVERLHLAKNSATGPSFYITNDSTGHTNADGLQIGFDGLNNAQIRNRENTELKLYTNNTPRLTVTNNGFVGIGTDAPDAKLEVRGSSSTGIIVRSNSTQATDTNKALRVRNNSDTNTFHVSHKGQGYFAGSVGIGTASPANILHLSSTGTPTIQITDEDNSGIVKIENGSGSLFLNADTGDAVSNSKIQFSIDGTETLRIRSDGKLMTQSAGYVYTASSAGSLSLYGGNTNLGGGIVLGGGNADADIRFFAQASTATPEERLRITSSGHILPGTDNTQDLGSSSKRFANIYTGDLNLSNEGSANDVDGTWGQYTIQEGEDDLFLINRRTGKKYKFNLTEVD